MAKTVEIYTSPLCGFCHRAKRLLDARGIPYVEYDVLMDRDRKREMLARADGRYTVPQIFIDGEGIGGSDELVEMDRAGRLDDLKAA